MPTADRAVRGGPARSRELDSLFLTKNGEERRASSYIVAKESDTFFRVLVDLNVLRLRKERDKIMN